MLGGPYFGHPWRHDDKGEGAESVKNGSEENHDTVATDEVEDGMELSNYLPDPYNCPFMNITLL